LSTAAVDQVGRGHVWSGEAAIARKLVDQRGGFADALAEAKRLAGLQPHTPVEIHYAVEPPSLLGQLGRLVGIGGDDPPAPPPARVELPGAAAPLVDALRGALPGSLLVAPSTPQARMF
jgi:ClpP class serine protease